jgi:hypothetical protein
MGKTNKVSCMLLAVILTISSLVVFGSVSAQSLKPAVTEFSLQYVDNSYDVPPSSTSTTDIYGQATTQTTPGYHIANKSLEVTIKNPPGVDAYNFRWKAHNDSNWNYFPFDTDTYKIPPLYLSDSPGVPTDASDSEYTVIDLIPLNYISITSFDIQVMALYGDYHASPYVHIIPEIGDCYDYYFNGQASYWSSTQTLNIGSGEDTPYESPTSVPLTPTSSPENPTPTLPDSIDNDSSFKLTLEQTTLFVLATVIAVVVIVAIIFVKRRTNIPNPPPPPESADSSFF